MGHIHLDEVIARDRLLRAQDIVLHHFSARYATADVKRICEQRLPESLRPRIRVLGDDENPRQG